MNLARKLTAEFLGTAGLLVVVVGSGIMGEKLASGNAAIALLANSIATGAGLVFFLIYGFADMSDSHFNPAVTLVGSASTTFAGNNPKNFPMFIVTQKRGAFAAVFVFDWHLKEEKNV